MKACFLKPDVVADGESVSFDSGLAIPSFRIFAPEGVGGTISGGFGGGGFSDAAASFGAGTIIEIPQVGQVTLVPTQSFSTSICWLQLAQANFIKSYTLIIGARDCVNDN